MAIRKAEHVWSSRFFRVGLDFSRGVLDTTKWGAHPPVSHARSAIGMPKTLKLAVIFFMLDIALSLVNWPDT